MANAAMFWGAASYNNGILPYKHSMLGEAYTKDGQPARRRTRRSRPTRTWTRTASCRRSIRCRAGKRRRSPTSSACSSAAAATSARCSRKSACPTNPARSSASKNPAARTSSSPIAVPAPAIASSIPVLNIHKTRLNDPFIWMIGTNDNPGDYRSSGCSSCHVVYANDRDPFHSAIYAKFGNTGTSQQVDPTIPKNESGHPLKHEFTRQIPTSQCMICHMHQPNMFINTMLGYTMWDYESDAPFMWPEKQKYPTRRRSSARSSTAIPKKPRSAASGATSDFLKDVSLLNPQLQGHAVRRLPRSRLEFPRRLRARPQGRPARQESHRSSTTTIRTSGRRPCICSRSTSMSACSASTAISRRTTTATATSRPKSWARSKSSARIATARSTSCRR